MIKVVTKCDLCGSEDKVTMRINIPSGKSCRRTWFHDFFNIGGFNDQIDVCADCLERIRKEAQENSHD